MVHLGMATLEFHREDGGGKRICTQKKKPAFSREGVFPQRSC